MGWTKRDFITAAYNELGYGGGFDIQPHRLESALRTLDSMIAEWNAEMALNYPIAETLGGSNVNAETGVPTSANSAVYTNLAMRLAPSLGKAAMPQTVRDAKAGETRILNMKPVDATRAIDTTLTPAGTAKSGIYGSFLQDETT